VNAKAEPDLYEMPDARNVLAAGKRYVSKLDLSKSYFQILLDPKCKEYIAFSSFLGTFLLAKSSFGTSEEWSNNATINEPHSSKYVKISIFAD
jgi:hypothetical protein